MDANTQTQPQPQAKKTGGTVFVNDEVIQDAKDWVTRHGSTMSWFFATGAKLLFKSMRDNPKFMDSLDVEDYKDAAG